MQDQVSTRRLRIVKYRGTSHGTNEYPFLIDEAGISVLPVTSLGLAHGVSEERVSTGIERLDTMLGGEGYFRGSSILVSGTAGSGKSSIAAHFVDAACRRGERCLVLAFEESPDQIVRNMRSQGLDLQQWIDKGLLRLVASRPGFYGMELHLAVMHRLVDQFKPQNVVVDPISNLEDAGTSQGAGSLLLRMIDFLKGSGITAMLVNLTTGGTSHESTDVGVSSLIDTWLVLRDIEWGGERNRGLYVIKSRGMAHSNQIREFLITSHGIQLEDVYVGPEGVLAGSARLAQEARERAGMLDRQQQRERRQRELARRRAALDAQIQALRDEFESVEEEARLIAEQALDQDRVLSGDREAMRTQRGADQAED